MSIEDSYWCCYTRGLISGSKSVPVVNQCILLTVSVYCVHYSTTTIAWYAHIDWYTVSGNVCVTVCVHVYVFEPFLCMHCIQTKKRTLCPERMLHAFVTFFFFLYVYTRTSVNSFSYCTSFNLIKSLERQFLFWVNVYNDTFLACSNDLSTL